MYRSGFRLNPYSGRREFIPCAPACNTHGLARNELDGRRSVCELEKLLNTAISATSSSYLAKIPSKSRYWVTDVTSSSMILCSGPERLVGTWLLAYAAECSTHAAGLDLVYSCVRSSQQIETTVTISDLCKHVNVDILAN